MCLPRWASAIPSDLGTGYIYWVSLWSHSTLQGVPPLGGWKQVHLVFDLYHQVLVEVLISAGSQEKKQWRNTGLWIRGGGPGYKGHVIANQSISKTNKTETKVPSEFWEQAESRMPLELSKQASKQNRTSRQKCFPDRLDTLHQILWRQTEKVSIKWPQIPCFNVETVSWRFIVLQNKERHKSRQI